MTQVFWKGVLAGSAGVMALGALLLIFAIRSGMPPRAILTSLMVLLIGALTTRIGYRGLRHAEFPTLGASAVLLPVIVFSLVWIAINLGGTPS